MKSESKILKPSHLKIIGLLIISALFVIGGYFILEENTFIGWASIIFFGLGLLVSIIQLFPNASYLKLTKEGFEVRSLFRSHFTKWSDVKVFKTGYVLISMGQVGTRKKYMVMYDFEKGHTKQRIGKSLSKAISNSDAALPDSYGLSVEELVELMNGWKTKNKNSLTIKHQ